MVRKILYIIFLFILLISCTNNGKWEIIKSNPPTYGIPTEEIYFQNEKSGIFGGYKLIENQNSLNYDKIDQIPTIYITNSLGKSYDSIPMPKNILGNVYKLYLNNKIIICQIENGIYKTDDLGNKWLKIYEGNIELSNFEILNENKMFFIVKNKKNKHLVKIENSKIDTLKSFERSLKIILTKNKTFTYSENTEYKTQIILAQNIGKSLAETIRLDKNHSIIDIKQLTEDKFLIATETKLFTYEKKKVTPINSKFLKDFYIKDILCNKNIIITICKERNTENAVTDDVYFISYDYGENWNELQREFGSNRKKFLYKNKLLISYESPYGLQKIKL